MDLTELLEIAEKERQTRKAIRLRVCVAAGCLSANAQAVKDAARRAVARLRGAATTHRTDDLRANR
jgi:bidirectional [NiFe] hydrogenase diaphorase subunit